MDKPRKSTKEQEEQEDDEGEQKEEDEDASSGPSLAILIAKFWPKLMVRFWPKATVSIFRSGFRMFLLCKISVLCLGVCCNDQPRFVKMA